MTVGELILLCEQRLTQAGVAFGHGTTNAYDEAAWLVLWRLGLGVGAELDGSQGVAGDTVPPDAQAQVFALLDERIRSRKPVAYLTQQAWLQGVPFFVDERSIVPRSLIAELLADPQGTGALDHWLNPDTHTVLDLCTGNASLAVLASLVWPEVQVTGTDLSEQALEVAAINVQQHRLQDRISLRRCDCFAPLDGGPALERFDLILCNPPYVNAVSMAALPPEFKAEPALALAGGADGMDFVRRLITQAAAYMTERAVLVLEIGNEQAHFEAAFAGLPAVWLETSAGEHSVLLLQRADLPHAQAQDEARA